MLRHVLLPLGWALLGAALGTLNSSIAHFIALGGLALCVFIVAISAPVTLSIVGENSKRKWIKTMEPWLVGLGVGILAMIGATYTLRLQADENEAKIRKDTQAAQILENLHSANRALEREQARANELERRRTLEVQRTSEISALIAAEIDAGTSIANNIQGAADRNSPDVADDRFEIVFTPLVEKWRERVEVMLDRELPGLISGPSSRQFVVLGRQEQPGDSCDSLGVSRTCAESNGPCPYMYRESLGSVAHRRA